MLRHIPPPTKTVKRPVSQQMTDMSGQRQDPAGEDRYHDDAGYPSDDGAYPSGVYHDDPQYPSDRYTDDSYPSKQGPPEDDHYAAERYAEKQPYPEDDYDTEYRGSSQASYPVDLGANRGYSDA